jgi:hypothetical protein
LERRWRERVLGIENERQARWMLTGLILAAAAATSGVLFTVAGQNGAGSAGDRELDAACNLVRTNEVSKATGLAMQDPEREWSMSGAPMCVVSAKGSSQIFVNVVVAGSSEGLAGPWDDGYMTCSTSGCWATFIKDRKHVTVLSIGARKGDYAAAEVVARSAVKRL